MTRYGRIQIIITPPSPVIPTEPIAAPFITVMLPPNLIPQEPTIPPNPIIGIIIDSPVVT
jgi:hypothetical protein